MKLDSRKLNRLYTVVTAKQYFKQDYQIYVYFRPDNYEDDSHRHYRFDPSISFEDNYKIVKEMFVNCKGFYKFYSDNQKYSIEEKEKNLNKKESYKQLNLFDSFPFHQPLGR